MAKHNPSMGGLEVPETDDLNQELGRQLLDSNGGGNFGPVSNQINMLDNSSFASASKRYDGIEKVDDLSKAKKKAKKEEENDFMKSMAKRPVPVRKTIDEDNAGAVVKIGSKFIKVSKIVKIAVILVVVLALFALFVPPVITTNVVDSKAENNNIFASKGISELKVEYAKNYSMVENSSFSSEKAENYREVFLKFNVYNLSFFQTRIPQFELAASKSTSPDRIIYVGNDQLNDNASVVQPFSKGEVTVKVLINVENLDDYAFRDLVRGMVIKTKDMGRKITKTTYCPTIPAYIFVSDSVDVKLNP
ncbi:MAG: hypothetical protein IJ696_02560 [Ruminococcus sp.]|nr:hypothetical protein [Ruminococcus sp.]